MRVLAISHSCVVDVNQQLFVELDRLDDVDVGLIVPARWRGDYAVRPEPPTFLPEIRFPVYLLPVAVPGHISLHYYKRLPVRRLRAFRPDALLSAQEPWSLSGLQASWLARKLKVPFVFQTNQNLFKRYPPPFSWIEQFSYRTARVALAYSEEARQVMVRKGFRSPSEVVPYPTDAARFAPSDPAPLRGRLGLEKRVVVGSMGRLVPEKGLDTLLQAASRIRAERGRLDIALLIVGSGPEDDNLRQQAARLGISDRVVFTGAVPYTDAAAYLNAMDVLALPSRTTRRWKEQFGRVLLEAMACGVPVVGSDSGAIPGLIRDTGGGLVFREGDPDDLARKLIALLEDPGPRSCLGQAGRRSVHDRFTCEAVAAKLYEILAPLGPR